MRVNVIDRKFRSQNIIIDVVMNLNYSFVIINPLTPNDPRTAPLTSNFAFHIFIQQI